MSMRGFDPDRGFDGGLGARLRRRKIRRVVLFVAMVACFVEFVGLPYVRMEPSRGGASYYLGVTGAQPAGPNGANPPLIVFLPLDQPLWRRAVDRISGLVAALPVSTHG